MQLNGSRKVIGVLRGYDVRLPGLRELGNVLTRTLGFPEYCAGRRRGGEGWRGEG